VKFKDHFSNHAANYAAARPTYPPELFEYLASECATRERAWDCATGNGQAARALAFHFQHVIATDASQSQIEQAEGPPNIDYRVLAAEQKLTPDEAVDLITVAQALHWFDIERFFANVDKVLNTGGILAVWSYEMTQVTPVIDGVVHKLYENILGEFWPPERLMVERRYADVHFPYLKLQPPEFQMQCEWTLAQLQNYLLSWSASQRYIASKKANPLDLVAQELKDAWSDTPTRSVSWPLTLCVRRK